MEQKTTTLSEDLLQQRAQLSHLYEQQESASNGISAIRQVISTLEYAIKKEEGVGTKEGDT